MKLNRYLLLAMLSVCLLVVSGCGEDKTIYENASSGSTTTGGTTTTTVAGATTTTLGSGTSGQALFASKCGSCHAASAVAKTTLAKIKAANMEMGLNDTQLQQVVDYLATK